MPTTEEARAAASNFACESCGSQLLFDPDTQGLRCDHCGREEEIPALLVEAPEYLYNPMTDSYDAPNWEAMGNKTVRCKNCGAEEVVDAAAMTAACPFCGSQYVMDENEVTEGILPETLQPFKVSKVKAADLFKSWAKSRFWAPGAFKKTRHTTRELQGLYLPFWTFDADLYSQYTGEGGRDRTETYTTTDSEGNTQTHTRTVTDWYPISGDAALSFDDEAVCATTHVDKGMLGRLGAYDVKVLRRYSPAFLAGFGAQRYDVGVGQGWKEEAAPRMQSNMERHVESSRGFDHYRCMRYSHQFSNVKFKHILLPVWMSSYSYKNKVYNFMINGETGVVAGKSPVSALKVTLAVLLGLGLAALIVLLLMYFGNN